jgi:hypothetical protein
MTATAWAGLGGDLPSVVADAAALQGVAEAGSGPQYSVQDIRASSGLQVREYLDSKGIVFAVSWSGPVMPELQRLLGSYYAEYSAAVAAVAPGGLRRGLNVVLPDLVVQSGGHLRAYAGRAYLPTLLPAGVTVSTLQ